MTFDDILDQIIALLKRQGRVSYGAIKRRFELDDDYFEDIKIELVEAQRLAEDENGRILVWAGEREVPESTTQPDRTTPPDTQDDPATSVETQPAETHTPDVAERRQLTVMFCDLVGSTSLSSELDPEDLRDLIRGYQNACTEVIQRYEGHVAQLLGDGLLVYFGYPVAHEDDAQRAIHAGLGMLNAMGTFNQRLDREQAVRLAIRVGIHTGLVVVGEMGGAGRQEQLALGEAPNVAARLQGLAESDTVVISHTTHQLTQGYFEHEALGEQLLRGVAEPMMVYQVLRDSGAQSRLDIATTRGLTPLVGRESEVALLLDRWEQVQGERGQVVLLSGEAGIGKSRLVQVLKEHVVSVAHTQLECRSAPYYQNTALYPIIDLLQRMMGWEQVDSDETKLHKLEETLGRYRLNVGETMPLFAALLSLPLPEDRYAPFHLTPQRQRQKTLETLVALLVEESERQAVFFIVEDLHWTDPTTLEMLELLIDQTATASLFILLTSRPEFEPTWSHRTHLAELSLSRLSQSQIEQMVDRVANSKRLPDEVIRELIEKTDGVPLYLEEMTKAVIESGVLKELEDHYELTGSVASLAIPATLHDSLMARLDRLTSAKSVAQLGAVIGRTFSYELLESLTPLEAPALEHELQRLVEAELVYQRGLPPQTTYVFKHALVQDAAYASLLKSTRQQYHQRIAQVLEERFPEIATTQPELLAYHATEAGLIAPAIRHWQVAGEKAAQRSAHVEAITHLSEGLELLRTLPPTPERDMQELTLQRTLGVALLSTKGFSAPEVERAYARARELCQQIGDTSQIFPVLFGLWGYYEGRGDLQTAREIAEQLLTLAEQQHNPALILQGHRALGDALYYLGEFVTARAHLERGIVLYDPNQHRDHAFLYGQDPGIGCRVLAALTIWLLGYPDAALQHVHEALTMAQSRSHPFSLLYALNNAGRFYEKRREWQQCRAHAETLIVRATEQELSFWVAAGKMRLGYALAMEGHVEEGIARMMQGHADCPPLELQQPYYLSRLAEVHAQAGQENLGLNALAQALAIVDNQGQRCWTAELCRLKGELLLQQAVPDTSQAEACFHQAFSIARQQNAKSWELRAATSLAKLRQQQGKRQEAYDVLSPVYGWFTEGFDTADLQDAKALLDELDV